MSLKAAKKTAKTTEKIAKNLVIGDRVLSASSNKLLVTMVIRKENRTIVLFDGDMEVDFEPYQRLNVFE
jgi:hypothetical protein